MQSSFTTQVQRIVQDDPTEIWTRTTVFRNRRANHYTIGPLINSFASIWGDDQINNLIVCWKTSTPFHLFNFYILFLAYHKIELTYYYIIYLISPSNENLLSTIVSHLFSQKIQQEIDMPQFFSKPAIKCFIAWRGNICFNCSKYPRKVPVIYLR